MIKLNYSPSFQIRILKHKKVVSLAPHIPKIFALNYKTLEINLLFSLQRTKSPGL